MRFVILIYFIFIRSVLAQTVEPSMAVEKRMLQLEFESLYLVEKEAVEKINSWSIPSVLMRYGVTTSIELQANVPLLREAIYQEDIMVSSRTFLDKVQLGLSANLWKEKGVLPETAIMIRALIPVYDNSNNDVGRLVALNMSNSLTDAVSLNYNFGWVPDEGEDSAYYIANLAWDTSSRVHTFIELFGSTYRGFEMTHNINTGIGFNMGNSFCIDLSVANGLNQDMFYFGGVLTYQLNL